MTKYNADTTISSNMIKKPITGKILGDLECEIMDIAWSRKDAVSIKNVVEILSRKRQIAYTTVMTIMVRLVNKSVLDRFKSGPSYLYKPRISKEQFAARAVHGIFSSVVSTLGEEVLTHFVKEIQKISPKKKQELLKILGEN